MAQLSITTAWNEAAAFVKREAGLLFPVAFMLIALPGGIVQLVMPVAEPGRPPEIGPWLLVVPVAVVIGMIGSIALSFLALRPGASVGEALQVGARRFIMLLGASLLIGIAGAVLLIPVIAVIGGGAAMGGAPEAMAGAMLLVLLVSLVVALAAWVRLLLMTPVTAVENVGPIGIIRRSWELTRGHFWKLLGCVLLLILLFMVISLVVGALAGILIVLVAGLPEPGSLGALLITFVGALVNMVVTVYFTALIARIYVQLAGDRREDVFA